MVGAAVPPAMVEEQAMAAVVIGGVAGAAVSSKAMQREATVAVVAMRSGRAPQEHGA